MRISLVSLVNYFCAVNAQFWESLFPVPVLCFFVNSSLIPRSLFTAWDQCNLMAISAEALHIQ